MNTPLIRKRNKKLSKKEIYEFLSTFVELYTAGIDVRSILSYMEKIYPFCEEIFTQIKNGEKLFVAFKMTNRFPDYVIYAIQIGEESGRLDNTLKQLLEVIEDEIEFISMIKNSLTYPAVVLGIASCIIFYYVMFVLPTLRANLPTLKMPGFTKVLFMFSDILNVQPVITFVVFSGIIGLLIYFLMELKNNPIRFKIPIIGRILLDIELNIYFHHLYLMCSAGITETKAINLLVENKPDDDIVILFKKALEGITRHGIKLSTALEGNDLLFPFASNLIEVGEKTGRLDGAFLKISQIYRTQLKKKFKKIDVILAPILVVGVGVFVLLAALFIFLPMYDSIGQLR